MQTRLFTAPLGTPCPTRPSPLDIDGLLAFHRSMFGGARMGPDEDPPADPPADDPKADKKFTQADLERIGAREKDQGKRAGAAEAHKTLMKTLGLPEDTKPEDVKATLDKAKKAELDAMSDAERAQAQAKAAQDAATAAQKAAEQERDDAKRERHEGRVAGLLERAGVGVGKEFDEDTKKRDRALAQATKLLEGEVEVGADSDDIRKAIATLKKDMPALFGTVTTTLPGGAPAGTPPGQRQKGESVKDAGRKLAEKQGWIKPEKQTA